MYNIYSRGEMWIHLNDAEEESGIMGKLCPTSSREHTNFCANLLVIPDVIVNTRPMTKWRRKLQTMACSKSADVVRFLLWEIKLHPGSSSGVRCQLMETCTGTELS